MATKDHDAVYRRLFRHRAMVEDLLRRFVGGEWVDRLDFDTLELMPSHYVSDDLRDRQDDRVWRLRIDREPGDVGDRLWFYVYVVLEFQSTSDRTMALRLLAYLALLYQDIARDLDHGDKLPPVLPVVLYNGKRPWTAPRSLQAMVETAPVELSPYQPRFTYLLFDETRHPSEQIQAADSPVSAVFRLEQAKRPEELAREIGRIVELVESSQDFSGLREEFTLWLKRVLLPKRFPGATIEAIQDLEELRTMLEETVDSWTQEWMAEGRRDGLAEGRRDGLAEGRRDGLAEGRRDGAKQIFIGLLIHRFGPPPAGVLERVDTATVDEIERWSQRVLDADGLDAVFATP